jgi:RNA polymerase sigma factor (sigma-70 family)
MQVVDSPSDAELLNRFTRERSHEALGAIVRRHIDLVYSAALRRVRDPHLAEDVTQAVFLMLWQRPQSLRRGTHLIGWLYQSTKYAAANALRMRRRRKAHEAAAGALPRSEQRMDSLWKDVEPLLDEALDRLGRGDRELILLRYFRGHSVREVAQTIGIAENTAAKRISRAIERLRGLLAERGVGAEASALTAALSSHAIHSTPAALLHSVTTYGAASAALPAAGIAKGAFIMIATQKAKLIVAVIIAAMVVPTTVGVIAIRRRSRPALSAAATPAVAATPIATTDPAADPIIQFVRFDGTPFSDVMDFFRNVSGANIFVDWNALESAGLPGATGVTAQFSDVKLFKAIQGVLDTSGHGAQYSIGWDGVILISTPAGLERLRQRQEWAGPAYANWVNPRQKLPSIKLDGVAISDAIDFMRDVTGKSVQVNWDDLAAKGIDRKAQVSLTLKDVNPVTALDLMLYQVGREQMHVVPLLGARGDLRITTTPSLVPPATQPVP